MFGFAGSGEEAKNRFSDTSNLSVLRVCDDVQCGGDGARDIRGR